MNFMIEGYGEYRPYKSLLVFVLPYYCCCFDDVIGDNDDSDDRMDKDNTLKIDWNEWRNYLILSPTTNIHDILHYWRHASVGCFSCTPSCPLSLSCIFALR